jgi:hypothetical protein
MPKTLGDRIEVRVRSVEFASVAEFEYKIAALLRYRMAPVEFDGRTFKTQSLAVAFVRENLCRLGATHDLRASHPEEFSMFMKLLERHPDAGTKLKNTQRVEVRIVTRTKEGLPAYGLMLHYADKDPDDISWRYCLEKKKPDTPMYRLMAAMRHSVAPQIVEYRSAAAAAAAAGALDCINCDHCGVPVRLSDMHVDHVVEFKALASGYLESTEHSIPAEVQDDPIVLNRHRLFETDAEFERGWQEYHRRHAKLQRTCMQCNLSTLKRLRRPGRVCANSAELKARWPTRDQKTGES